MDPSTRSTRRTALAILSATATAWWSGGAHAQAKGEFDPKVWPQIRIGFQKGSFNQVLLKSLGYLERNHPGTKVSWVEFPAGPQLLEALSVGSVDFGGTGDAPPVFAQAANKDLFYVGAEPPKPDSSAILVKPDAPLKTLADLKGRRIAFQRGSSAHFLVVQALKKGQVDWSQIQPVYLAPSDARVAFAPRVARTLGSRYGFRRLGALGRTLAPRCSEHRARPGGSCHWRLFGAGAGPRDG
jgi:sulfonate transport system substrate-binding protein